MPVDGDHGVSLPRAPDVRDALREAWGDPDGTPSLVALRELLGLIGAHEWRKKGVEIAEACAYLHGQGARAWTHELVLRPRESEWTVPT